MRLARRIPGGASNDLDDLPQRILIADGQCMFAPRPVETLLSRAKDSVEVRLGPIRFVFPLVALRKALRLCFTSG